MKIDYCLISSDINTLYLELWPLVRSMWKDVCGVEALLVLIADELPDYLVDHAESIILFKPIPNIHTAFQAQCIRLLYPCILDIEPGKTVMVSDMDIIPARRSYFVDSVTDISLDKFVSYRDAYIDRKMVAICYNVATVDTWRSVFGINSLDDVRTSLKNWYNPEYDGKKNCPGWFTDQEKLYEYLDRWPDKNIRHVILSDEDLKFCRLDKRQKKYILENKYTVLANIGDLKYIDFHFIRPPTRFRKFIESLAKEIRKANST